MYVTQMCAELRTTADKELEARLTAHVARTVSKKRTWREAELDPNVNNDVDSDGVLIGSYPNLPLNGMMLICRVG